MVRLVFIFLLISVFLYVNELSAQYKTKDSPFVRNNKKIYTLFSNDSVGIGLNYPEGKFHVLWGGNVNSPNALANTLVLEKNSDHGLSILSPSVNSGYIFFGDEASPTAGRIQYVHGPDRMLFWSNNVERLRLDSGGIGVNGALTPTANGGSVIVFKDNINTPTLSPGTAGLYAKSVSGVVEVFAIGSDGLGNQLSSHNPKTRELWHYAFDEKTGRHLQIDIERLAKWIDEHFGTNFVKEWYEPKPLFNELKPRDSFLRTEQ